MSKSQAQAGSFITVKAKGSYRIPDPWPGCHFIDITAGEKYCIPETAFNQTYFTKIKEKK